MNTKIIVLIHGLFMNPNSWQDWKQYFEQKGFTCYTPAYPYHEGDVKMLRTKSDDGLKQLNFAQVVDSLKLFIEKLPSKPILIGHSMGGLVVQKLIEMDLAVAGVCIDAAPPQGIFTTQWSFLKANFPTINPLKGNSVCLPSVKWFHYSFCNTMSMEQTNTEYQKFVAPESRNIPRSSTGKQGKIDFKKAHAPLLFIAGSKDHIIPAPLNYKNYKAYTHAKSITAYKIFENRTHYICAQENWQEVADYSLTWLQSLK